MLQLPPDFAQTDSLIHQIPSIERRSKAEGLLQTCLMLERQFAVWLSQSMGSVGSFQARNAATFNNVYEFHDELTAFTMLYYWMSQIIFHRCILDLCAVIDQPVLDPYTGVWLALPNKLRVDPAQYHDGRELATKIRCGLDSALRRTSQPDLLVAPMTVALDFYRDLQMASHDGSFKGMTSQEGVFETIELKLFRTRLIAKGQGVANSLQRQIWNENAQY